ncbi:MAG: UGSC family (seleno)protein, partial [Dehalococcoidia bacterium]|nr:UGSC family (seleno)protein [Dehalococcoidia bacterium]
MVRASIEAEKAGIRTCSIVAGAFAPQARAVSQAMGFSNLALAEYPGVILFDRAEEFQERVAGAVVDQIVDSLARSLEMTVVEAEPGPRDIVFAGTLDEVQEHFHKKLWSDGLPVIPPTIERVERFLRFTDRSPEEVLGRLPPEKREATVWNVAVNGVMSGCRPEYMPILLAIVEAISEPVWRIEDAGST